MVRNLAPYAAVAIPPVDQLRGEWQQLISVRPSDGVKRLNSAFTFDP